MSYYCPHCRVRFYSGDERCECRATLVLEGGAPGNSGVQRQAPPAAVEVPVEKALAYRVKALD